MLFFTLRSALYARTFNTVLPDVYVRYANVNRPIISSTSCLKNDYEQTLVIKGIIKQQILSHL